MDDFSVTPRKHRQRSQRLDYHLLNDGSDGEAAPEDRIVKRFRSNRAGSVEITQDDSASQLTQRQSSPADSSQQPELTYDGRVDRSSVSSRGKGPIEDREIRCTRCNWRTTDSARATSTSNMRFHLAKHGISSSTKQPSIASFFQKRAEDNAARSLERNLVRRSSEI
ncbi:hypothetical protein V1522DRAFT_455843 [Lipomyces starkeyi]